MKQMMKSVSLCSRKMGRSMPKCFACWAMAGAKQCALMAPSAFAIFRGRCIRKYGKADVILKYMQDEARLMKAYGELPESMRLNEGIIDDEEDGGGDDYIEFEDEDIDKM